MKKYTLFFVLLVLGFQVKAQEDAKVVIGRVLDKFNTVKDYQADALIDTKISFLNMLPQKAKIFYKQPNKFRVKSTGIAILPKQNFDNLFNLLAKEDGYQAFTSGSEIINGYKTMIINVIPNADTSDLVLAKIWVDNARNLIVKSQLTTKSNGTVLIEYEHGKHIDTGLADKITFTVEIKKYKIPKAISADINSPTSKVPPGKEPKTGKILITLSNYIINKGVPDSVFK